jgi:hypothetical protein
MYLLVLVLVHVLISTVYVLIRMKELNFFKNISRIATAVLWTPLISSRSDVISISPAFSTYKPVRTRRGQPFQALAHQCPPASPGIPRTPHHSQKIVRFPIGPGLTDTVKLLSFLNGHCPCWKRIRYNIKKKGGGGGYPRSPSGENFGGMNGATNGSYWTVKYRRCVEVRQHSIPPRCSRSNKSKN